MCLGVPFKVTAINPQAEQLTIEAYGKSKTVSSMLLDATVTVGDYVLVQVGDFAVEVMDEGEAKICLQLLAKVKVGRHEQ